MRGPAILTGQRSLPSSIRLGFHREGDAIVIFDEDSGKSVLEGSTKHEAFSGHAGLDEETFMEAVGLATWVANASVSSRRNSGLPLKPEYREFFNSLDNLLSLHPPERTKLTDAQEDDCLSSPAAQPPFTPRLSIT